MASKCIYDPGGHRSLRTLPLLVRKGEPRLDLLSDARATHAVYGQSGHITVHDDGLRLVDPAHRLPETWTGEPIFKLAVTTPRAPTSSPPRTTFPQFPLVQDGHDWEKSGTTWARCHNNYVCDFHHPVDDQAGGPDYHYVEDKRVTFKNCGDGSDDHIEDVCKDASTRQPTDKPWAGRTVFYELGSYPQVYDHDVTEESRLPRHAPAPKDPTTEKR